MRCRSEAVQLDPSVGRAQVKSLLNSPQVYISEIAYPAVRGLLGSCVQLMVVTGILLAYVAGRFACCLLIPVYGYVAALETEVYGG